MNITEWFWSNLIMPFFVSLKKLTFHRWISLRRFWSNLIMPFFVFFEINNQSFMRMIMRRYFHPIWGKLYSSHNTLFLFKINYFSPFICYSFDDSWYIYVYIYIVDIIWNRLNNLRIEMSKIWFNVILNSN